MCVVCIKCKFVNNYVRFQIYVVTKRFDLCLFLRVAFVHHPQFFCLPYLVRGPWWIDQKKSKNSAFVCLRVKISPKYSTQMFFCCFYVNFPNSIVSLEQNYSWDVLKTLAKYKWKAFPVSINEENTCALWRKGLSINHPPAPPGRGQVRHITTTVSTRGNPKMFTPKPRGV